MGVQHESLSNIFASKLGSEERFEQGDWTELVTGAPVLEDALVSFDCEIEDIQQVGSHSVFMCRVVAIQQSQQDESLIYFNRAYHHVAQIAEVESA